MKISNNYLLSVAFVAATTAASTSSHAAFMTPVPTQTSMMSKPSTTFRRRRRGSTAIFADEGGDPSAEIQAKLKAQMTKLMERDRSSKVLEGDDLDVVYEDEHIVVVNKPCGVLTVPGKEGNPSLGGAVFSKYGCESGSVDKMIVHRLGMDTSGLVVFARTDAALRNMNTLFRTRKITREYEALVCGKVSNDCGTIDLPLMRDYEYPPYMRVSTDARQQALVGLDVGAVGKKILESPKDSLTEYAVVSHEDVDAAGAKQDVTRVKLTSVSGRTHQLNVHCAAIGHPIVGDGVYGYGGEAAPNGGLSDSELPDDAADEETQKAIAGAFEGKSMCVHAKSLSFEHPVTKEKLSFECPGPF